MGILANERPCVVLASVIDENNLNGKGVLGNKIFKSFPELWENFFLVVAGNNKRKAARGPISRGANGALRRHCTHHINP
jgi:hypothetical protein